jgi:hypothetical protein
MILKTSVDYGEYGKYSRETKAYRTSSLHPMGESIFCLRDRCSVGWAYLPDMELLKMHPRLTKHLMLGSYARPTTEEFGMMARSLMVMSATTMQRPTVSAWAFLHRARCASRTRVR